MTKSGSFNIFVNGKKCGEAKLGGSRGKGQTPKISRYSVCL